MVIDGFFRAEEWKQKGREDAAQVAVIKRDTGIWGSLGRGREVSTWMVNGVAQRSAGRNCGATQSRAGVD